MEIKLSTKEKEAFKRIIKKVTSKSGKSLKKNIDSNPLVSYNEKIDSVSIIFNENYVCDFLAILDKYIGILVNQVKIFIDTFNLFDNDFKKLNDKYHTIKKQEEI